MPFWFQWIGKWHPLMLHFPLVLVFITIIQYLRHDKYARWYLVATTLLSLLSAISGLILSIESGASGNTISAHKWLGVGITLLLVFWLNVEKQLHGRPLIVLQSLMTMMIIATGHLGGTITHGADFLALKKPENTAYSLPDNPNIFTDIVQPVLNEKCGACHNENKAKGKLNLLTYESIMLGGESGITTASGENTIIHHIGLPQDHEDHMPPKDEKQLTSDELIILQSWFDLGADKDLNSSDLDDKSQLASVISKYQQAAQMTKWHDLPEVSHAQIENLSTDYFTIRRLYAGSNALEVMVYPHQPFDQTNFKNLRKIAKNTIALNLNSLSLTSDEFKTIRLFKNLENLNISGCQFTSIDFNQIGKMENLEFLKAYNTPFDDDCISSVSNFPALRSLFVYNTSLTDAGEEKLISSHPDKSIVFTAPGLSEFDASLPLPKLNPLNYFFCDPFFLKPTHPLSNVQFHYLSDKESGQNRLLEIGDSLLIDASVKLKYHATKPGWSPSAEDSMVFMQTCVLPDTFYLENRPNEKYTGKSINILFDRQKGPLDFNDNTWMGFTEQNFILYCNFDDDIKFSSVQLSSLLNTDPYLFPPSRIQVFGRLANESFKVLGETKINLPQKRAEAQFRYYRVNLADMPVRQLKIVAEPVSRIPLWHQGKDKPAWFFIDEVILSIE